MNESRARVAGKRKRRSPQASHAFYAPVLRKGLTFASIRSGWPDLTMTLQNLRIQVIETCRPFGRRFVFGLPRRSPSDPRAMARAGRPPADGVGLVTSALFPTYARADLAFERGEGAWLFAANGDRYLDFGGGVAVNSLGHAHPRLVATLARGGGKALARLQSFSDPAGRTAGAAARRRDIRRSRVLLQLGRRSGRMRDQDRAKIPRGQRRARALSPHHLRGRVPRAHAGDHRRRRQTKNISTVSAPRSTASIRPPLAISTRSRR